MSRVFMRHKESAANGCRVSERVSEWVRGETDQGLGGKSSHTSPNRGGYDSSDEKKATTSAERDKAGHPRHVPTHCARSGVHSPGIHALAFAPSVLLQDHRCLPSPPLLLPSHGVPE